MDGLDRLDLFHLGEHGDRHEREFWPLLSKLFPSYEILWRRLIVPLTCRIDTLDEIDYYKNGGILQYVLRNMLKSAA